MTRAAEKATLNSPAEVGPEGLASTHPMAAGQVPAQGCSARAVVPSVTTEHISCASETSESSKPKLRTEESRETGKHR